MSTPLSESRLRQDLHAAMKARDALTTAVLRGLLAAITNSRIERGGGDLTEPDLLALIRRESKKREEAEGFARTAGRTDLVEQNAAEQQILARYLPRALDDAQLDELVRRWIGEGLGEIGPLMARLKERHPGQYDGKRASEIVRRRLAGG